MVRASSSTAPPLVRRPLRARLRHRPVMMLHCNPSSPAVVAAPAACGLRLVVGTFLLLLRNLVSSAFDTAPHGCKSCPARTEEGCPRPRPRSSAKSGGKCGSRCGAQLLLLLLLAAWLRGCSAGGTVCSTNPEACNGTYSGTELCAAPLPHHPRCEVRRRAGSAPTPRAPLARRNLGESYSGLSGTVPTQLGLLTNLEDM